MTEWHECGKCNTKVPYGAMHECNPSRGKNVKFIEQPKQERKPIEPLEWQRFDSPADKTLARKVNEIIERINKED